MSAGDVLLLFLAGIGAGLCGTIAGLASLSSYPALLAVGLSPLAANVTNSVALLGNAAGSFAGARPELAGQGPRIRSFLGLTLAGGLIGTVVLLATPSQGFDYVVPLLVAGSAVLVVVAPRFQAASERRRIAHLAAGGAPSRNLGPKLAIVLVGIYGGYFGAGAGVMLTALLSVVVVDSLVRIIALRVMLMGSVNVIASLGFALFGPVHWLYTLPLGAGCVLGGYVAPTIVRRMPVHLLRWVIALGGLVLAVELGRRAYG